MRLTLELTPAQGALLLAAAQAEGVEVPTLRCRTPGPLCGSLPCPFVSRWFP
jgi:hypothetical protein